MNCNIVEFALTDEWMSRGGGSRGGGSCSGGSCGRGGCSRSGSGRIAKGNRITDSVRS